MGNQKFFAFIFALFFIGPFGLNASAQLTPRQERNLTAFTRLYGYVRYFYPGDEAQQIGWDQFAIYGSREILNEPNDKALINKLMQLYLPVAPAVKLSLGSQPISFNPKQNIPQHAGDLKVISWQHLGYGYSGFVDAYASIRLNRRDKKAKDQEKGGYIPIVQQVDVSKFAGEKFVITVRAKVITKQTGLTLKFLKDSMVYDRALLKPVSGQNVSDTLTHTYKLSGIIDSRYKKMVFGISVNNNVKVNIDSVCLFVYQKGKEIKIPLSNSLSYAPLGPYVYLKRYSVLLDDDEPDEPLFKKHAEIGEAIREALVPGINCMVPLALYGDKNNTYPIANAATFSLLKQQVSAVKVTDEARFTSAWAML